MLHMDVPPVKLPARLRRLGNRVEYASHTNRKGTRMKFGGIHLMGLPRPWTSQSERTLLNDALDIAELSDQCGLDYVWGTEHHFLEEYSHASAPEIFLAACDGPKFVYDRDEFAEAQSNKSLFSCKA